MTWTIKNGCFGCARCTYCEGIAMEGRTAKIVNQSAPCIPDMAQICPAGVIQQE